MGKLREKAYHLVVLFGRELGDHPEAHYPAELLAGLDGLGRVFVRWRDNIVCALEYLHARVLNAAALAPGHGVCADKLKIIAQHALNFIDDAALYARNVAYECMGLYILLIVFDPLDECVRIHGEDQQVKLRDVCRVYIRSAMSYYSLAQGVIYRLLPPGYRSDLKAVSGKRLCVAAAHETETEYKYFCVFIKLHFLPPSRVSRDRQNNSDSSF